MRCLTIICVLLAILIAVSANGRTKRTIPFIDAFTSSLLGIPKKKSVAEDVLLYKIPGYDDVLLKVTPKKLPKKKAEPIQIALATNSIKTNTQQQNKTCEDEPSGFQQMVDLIKVGIHNKKQLLGKLFGPAPVTPIIVINEQVKYPIIQEIHQPPPPAVGVKYTETVEVDSTKITVPKPVITRPKQVVTQVVQPTYSYKQGSKGGTVTSYEFEDNPNVIVTESVVMPALPPYIKSRFGEIVSAVGPIAPVVVETDYRFPEAVIRKDIVFGPPIIPGDVGHVKTPLPPVAPPIYPPAFARLQNMGYFEGGNFYGPPILVEEDIPVLLHSQTDIFKMPGPKGEVNVKITKNKSPISINSKVSTEASPSKVNFGNNPGVLPTPGGLSKTIPPPPSLSNIKFDSEPNLKASSQSSISQRSLTDVNNGISDNNVVINDEKGSSFVYKQVSNKNMQPLDVSLAAPNNNNLGNNNREIDDIATRMSNYYYVPPAGNVDPPRINALRASLPPLEPQVNNMGTLRPCLDVIQVTKSTVCPEPFYRSDGFLKNSPIVVTDSAPFVYKQMNADGSSMSMMGSQNNVVVDIKEKTPQNNRGDIPQTSLYK